MSMAELRQLVMQRMSGALLPAQRFFVPTNAFFEAMGQWKHIRFIEGGAGSGETSADLAAQGFDVVPVDLIRRAGQHPGVVIADAVEMPYGPEAWALICRPDHSGWCADAIERALESGARALYVGLNRNVEMDVGHLMERCIDVHHHVGEEDESMWVFA